MFEDVGCDIYIYICAIIMMIIIIPFIYFQSMIANFLSLFLHLKILSKIHTLFIYIFVNIYLNNLIKFPVLL